MPHRGNLHAFRFEEAMGYIIRAFCIFWGIIVGFRGQGQGGGRKSQGSVAMSVFRTG